MLGRFFVTPARRVSAYLLRRVQGSTVYRRAARKRAGGIYITLAGPDDLRKLFPSTRGEEDTLPDNSVSVFVAKKRHRIIGSHLLLRLTDETSLFKGYWLSGLDVAPSYRGMGIGENLMESSMRVAREEGAGEIWFLVHEDNHRAIRLFRKLGFERKLIPTFEEKLERERVSGRRMILMWKSLVENN